MNTCPASSGLRGLFLLTDGWWAPLPCRFSLLLVPFMVAWASSSIFIHLASSLFSPVQFFVCTSPRGFLSAYWCLHLPCCSSLLLCLSFHLPYLHLVSCLSVSSFCFVLPLFCSSSQPNNPPVVWHPIAIGDHCSPGFCRVANNAELVHRKSLGIYRFDPAVDWVQN